MKKLTLVLLCFMISIGWAFAQEKEVSGVVISAEDNQPLIGAAVFAKDSPSYGQQTNLDGKFRFTVPESTKTLVITYVGMKRKEVPVGQNLRVVLETDSEQLDEVIVVAYGTAKKSSFSGSASRVKGESLKKLQSSNVAKSLEGVAAGVQTSSSSGQPGSGASIIIRGLGSISASQSPLIVVDGVPYEGSLNSISQQDIADLNILKDAAANSMYGARGSNGVIMVTTRRGKVGKPSINFDSRVGLNTRGVPSYDIITDPGDYYKLYWRSLYNAMGSPEKASAGLIDGGVGLVYNIFKGVPNDQVVLTDGSLNPNARERIWNDDWTKDPFSSGIRQEYNVNVSGATEATNYYMSASYLSDEGYIKSSGFNRLSTRIKIEQKLANFLRIGSNIAYSKTDSKSPNTRSNNYSNLFNFSQHIAPIFPIYLYDMKTGNVVLDKDGNKVFDFGDVYKRPYAQQQNPYATNLANIRNYGTDNLTARGFAEFKFLRDFKFTLNMAYDVFNYDNTEFMTPIGGDAKEMNGRGYKWVERTQAMNINQLLNYDKTFGMHTVGVLLGHETKTDKYGYMFGHMTNFLDDKNPEFNNATKYQGLESYTENYALEGFFSRLEYNYGNKYYFTGSIRRDGSSRFHPDNRWGTFWAVGGSWRVTGEDFMSGLSWINLLKLKASYGTQGNDNIRRNIAYLDLYSVDRAGGEPALRKIARGNPNLTWEKSANFNVGFESRLLDRIDLGVEFFIKETMDLIYARPLSPSEGSPTTILRNELDMRNTGVEVDLGIDIIKKNNLMWNIHFNGTHYRNELTRLPSDKDPEGYAAGTYWRKKGGSLYDYYLKEYAGVNDKGLSLFNKYVKNKETGEETVETVEKSASATLREIHKSAIPDFYGGISTSLSAYGLDLSIQTSFQIGGWIYDSVYSSLMEAGEPGLNWHKDALNSWTPDNHTNIPRLAYGDQEVAASSDRWLTDASYFNIRNITLGYTLPKHLISKVNLKSLRIYLATDNVCLFSKRTGLDPRQSFNGASGNIYSALRTTSIGLSLGL